MENKFRILVLMAVIFTACEIYNVDDVVIECKEYKNIWQQVGSDIDGKAERDDFGTSVSLNSDGSIVAIGTPSPDTDRIGYVQVFQNVNETWQQIGLDIIGETAQDGFGRSISLNSDGSIVAIGVPTHYSNSKYGLVRVYENTNGSWTQLGNDIIGPDSAFFGLTVSLDSSGTTIAIIDAQVKVSVYKINNGTWEQIGQSISENSNNLRSLAFSLDGSVFAFSTSASGENTEIKGFVSIYRNISNNWIKIGDIIEGEDDESDFGASLSLNTDGSIVAIGGDTYNLSSTGFVKIYENISDQWTQIGKTIRGEEVGDACGTSVSLSSDGSFVAVGAGYNQNWTGHIRVFHNNDGKWRQIGNDINGESVSSLFGGSVSLSQDGLVVAGGAIWGDGTVPRSGQVGVYILDAVCIDY